MTDDLLESFKARYSFALDPFQLESIRAIQDGNAKVQAHEYQSAIARFTDALNQKPSEPLLAMAYRGLGIAYVYAGDAKRGVQYFKLYLPFCPDAERQQLDQTIARYGG